MCAPVGEHFAAVQRLLNDTKVNFTLNPRMVRGLDYYCRTTFEWTTTLLGSQSAVAAGGRYDGLVQELGGPAIPGRRLRSRRGAADDAAQNAGAAGASAGRRFTSPGSARPAHDWIFPRIHRLRQRGVSIEMEGEARSLKNQMRRADKLKASSVLIVGDDELNKGAAVVRDMASKQQEEIRLENLEAVLTARKAS